MKSRIRSIFCVLAFTFISAPIVTACYDCSDCEDEMDECSDDPECDIHDMLAIIHDVLNMCP